jgi:hypothetical protein
MDQDGAPRFERVITLAQTAHEKGCPFGGPRTRIAKLRTQSSIGRLDSYRSEPDRPRQYGLTKTLRAKFRTSTDLCIRGGTPIFVGLTSGDAG